jgi:hypothetical protein
MQIAHRISEARAHERVKMPGRAVDVTVDAKHEHDTAQKRTQKTTARNGHYRAVRFPLTSYNSINRLRQVRDGSSTGA